MEQKLSFSWSRNNHAVNIHLVIKLNLRPVRKTGKMMDIAEGQFSDAESDASITSDQNKYVCLSFRRLI